jgi:transcriptional regulator with XRE-family HTH domain
MPHTRLWEVRYQRGETQRQVAEKLGCTQQVYCFWENKKVRPRPVNARKLSDHFSRPIAELLEPINEKSLPSNAEEAQVNAIQTKNPNNKSTTQPKDLA